MPVCRLTPAKCAVTLREVSISAELFPQDQEIVSLGYRRRTGPQR